MNGKKLHFKTFPYASEKASPVKKAPMASCKNLGHAYNVHARSMVDS